MTTTYVALIRSHPADVIRVLAYQILVEVGECPSHLVGMILIHAKNDSLGKTVGLSQKVIQVTGNGLNYLTGRCYFFSNSANRQIDNTVPLTPSQGEKVSIDK